MNTNRFTQTNRGFEVKLTSDDFFELLNEKKKVIGIQCKLFGYLPYNRAAWSERTKFKKLQASINEGRLLSPIIVFEEDGKYKIKDGQGRLVAIYNYLVEKPYVAEYKIDVFVAADGCDKDIKDMNNTVTPWEMYDYAEYNMKLGDTVCHNLIAWIQHYDEFKYKTVIKQMRMSGKLEDGVNMFKADFAQGREILETSRAIRKYDEVVGKNATFIDGLAYIIRAINKEEITDVNIVDMPKILEPFTTQLSTLKIKDLKNKLLEIFKQNKVERDRSITDAVKSEVWKRDNGQCVQCGATNDIQYDHDIPFSLKGSNEVENIQLLCKTCNLKKGNRNLTLPEVNLEEETKSINEDDAIKIDSMYSIVKNIRIDNHFRKRAGQRNCHIPESEFSHVAASKLEKKSLTYSGIEDGVDSFCFKYRKWTVVLHWYGSSSFNKDILYLKTLTEEE